MTTKPAVQEKSTAVVLNDFFTKNKGELAKRCPSHLRVDRILTSAISAVNTNPTLAKCTVRSLFIGAAQAANLGFELNNAMNEAWLVPRRITNKATGKKVWTAGLIQGYQGMLNLARRCSDVTIVFGEVIRRRDVYRIDRGTNNLHHEIKLEGDRTPIAFYAKYYLQNGQSDFVILDMEDIAHIRSKAETDVIWNEWFIDMGKKSAIKKLCKVMPKSSELLERKRLSDAIEMDNKVEIGEDVNLEDFIDVDGLVVPDGAEQEEVKKKSTVNTVQRLKRTQKAATPPPPPKEVQPPELEPEQGPVQEQPTEQELIERVTKYGGKEEGSEAKSAFP